MTDQQQQDQQTEQADPQDETLRQLQGYFSGLTATEVTIGQTHFQIRKLLPMEANDVLEILRPALTRASLEIPADGMPEVMALQAVGLLPRDVLKEIRGRLFSQVLYRTPRMTAAVALAGGEDTAFEGCGPLAAYNMLMRCMAVNFFESFSDVASQFGPLLVGSAPQRPATSDPSSQSQ